MITFKYKALSRDGAPVSGVIEAYDEFEAVAAIKEQCPMVLRIDPIREKSRTWEKLNEPMSISDKTLSLVASQFAILLRSGLPAARTVEVVARQTGDKLMKKILTEVSQDVSAGYSLSQSLENRGKKIPATFIEMVRAGEEAGTLEDSFDRLTTYYEKSGTIRSKVRSAMVYPIFLAVLAVVVIAVVVNVTIPVIGGVITDGGGQLPLPTAMLLGMYTFTQQWWWMVLLVLLAIVTLFFLYGKTESGHLRLSALMTQLPVFGSIARMKASSQFASTMATLLGAGLSITKATAITARVMDSYAIGQSVSRYIAGLEEGKSLGSMLQPNPYLSPLLIEMATVGEESGALESTLGTISLYFDGETERAAAKALSLMEPIMTVVLGGIIGFIVIALYLPMFTMYTGM